MLARALRRARTALDVADGAKADLAAAATVQTSAGVGTDAGTSPPRSRPVFTGNAAAWTRQMADHLIGRSLAGSAALRHLDDPLSYESRQREKARLLRT
jgi:hypothetical protein